MLSFDSVKQKKLLYRGAHNLLCFFKLTLWPTLPCFHCLCCDYRQMLSRSACSIRGIKSRALWMVDSARSTELQPRSLHCLISYTNANSFNQQTQNRRTKQKQGPFLVYYECPSRSCAVDPVTFGVLAAAEKGGVRGHMVWADPDLGVMSADELSGDQELVGLCVICQGGRDTLPAAGVCLCW